LHWGIPPILVGKEILTYRRNGRQILLAYIFGEEKET